MLTAHVPELIPIKYIDPVILAVRGQCSEHLMCVCHGTQSPVLLLCTEGSLDVCDWGKDDLVDLCTLGSKGLSTPVLWTPPYTDRLQHSLPGHTIAKTRRGEPGWLSG